MASTHVSLLYHVVFSTKDRSRSIHAAWRNDLHSYLGGCAKGLEATAQQIGGIEDHVHLLLGMRATHCVADVVREIKRGSSRWIHEHVHTPDFAWQEGYGAFTVSRSNVDAVATYIQEQERHHAKRSFQDEYRELLLRHDVKFDERYLW